MREGRVAGCIGGRVGDTADWRTRCRHCRWRLALAVQCTHSTPAAAVAGCPRARRPASAGAGRWGGGGRSRSSPRQRPPPCRDAAGGTQSRQSSAFWTQSSTSMHCRPRANQSPWVSAGRHVLRVPCCTLAHLKGKRRRSLRGNISEGVPESTRLSPSTQCEGERRGASCEGLKETRAGDHASAAHHAYHAQHSTARAEQHSMHSTLTEVGVHAEVSGRCHARHASHRRHASRRRAVSSHHAAAGGHNLCLFVHPVAICPRHCILGSRQQQRRQWLGACRSSHNGGGGQAARRHDAPLADGRCIGGCLHGEQGEWEQRPWTGQAPVEALQRPQHGKARNADTPPPALCDGDW